MFHIKICGVRRTSDVNVAAKSGADAVGLNFFPLSARFVDPALPSTRQLSQHAADNGLLRVGVFVNESPERIAQIANVVGLDAVQLHGDEQPASALETRMATKLPLIRAIKLPTGELTDSMIRQRTCDWITAGIHLLFDADAGAAHGGGGKALHWTSLRTWADANPDVAWTLAGGLTSENVAKAIKASGAKSVDTASGVEERRGEKSERLVEQFVNESRAALGR